MTTKEVFHGVPGILRPFKEFIEKKGLKKGDQIVYYGVPGTCTPFVELLGFAVRSLELEQVFVPMVDESKAHKIHHVPDIGMQAGAALGSVKPKAIVIMGGLSMPNVPVKAEQVKAVIDRHSGALVIGVCFMHMFEKAGWLSTVSFDCLIDANMIGLVSTELFFKMLQKSPVYFLSDSQTGTPEHQFFPFSRSLYSLQ
jgi:hypothetical protein